MPAVVLYSRLSIVTRVPCGRTHIDALHERLEKRARDYRNRYGMRKPHALHRPKWLRKLERAQRVAAQ